MKLMQIFQNWINLNLQNHSKFFVSSKKNLESFDVIQVRLSCAFREHNCSSSGALVRSNSKPPRTAKFSTRIRNSNNDVFFA